MNELATHAVDQAVVDGLVDGHERRVRAGILIGIAFEKTAPPEIIPDFFQALAEEDRYVDRIRSLYSFSPTISPESKVKASLMAIVGGTALCSESERKEVLDCMEQMAQTVYYLNKKEDGILYAREVSGMLKAGGFTNLSQQQYFAFLDFMRQDPRFHRLGDGRVVLTGYNTNIDEIEELKRVDDIAAAVNQALPYLLTGQHGVFTESGILTTMNELGNSIRPDQLGEVREKLRLSPHVKVLDGDRYKLITDVHEIAGDTNDRPRLPLEVMLRDMRRGIQHKPNSRKRGGSRKRTIQM